MATTPPPRSVAVLLGTGYGGEDVFLKEPWLTALEGWEVQVASRIDPEVHLAQPIPVRGLDVAQVRDAVERLQGVAHVFEIGYKSAAFHAGQEDPAAAEAWLGLPLRYLTSMDRRFVDRRHPVDVRDAGAVRRAAAGWITFFRHFFDAHRPYVLVHTLEDDLFSVVAYHVAKRIGIRVVSLSIGRFPERGWMFTEDFGPVLHWNDGPVPLGQVRHLYATDPIAGEAQRVTKGYWDIGSLPDRVKDAGFIRTYDRFRGAAIGAFPDEASIIPPVALLKRAVDHAGKVVRRLRAARLGQAVADEPYFLFPLHYEEDAQITFREPFLDQMQVLRAAARSLPDGVWLYVKPHPHYFGTDQRLVDLQAISALPRVRMLEPSQAPGPLIRGAIGIITLNSTLGFEALVHGVPVLTLGSDFYCQEPPCRVVERLDQLPHALMVTMGSGRGTAQEAMERFVTRTYADTVKVEGLDLPPGVYGFTARDGAAMAQAFDAGVRGQPLPARPVSARKASA